MTRKEKANIHGQDFEFVLPDDAPPGMIAALIAGAIMRLLQRAQREGEYDLFALCLYSQWKTLRTPLRKLVFEGKGGADAQQAVAWQVLNSYFHWKGDVGKSAAKLLDVIREEGFMDVAEAQRLIDNITNELYGLTLKLVREHKE